MTDGDDPINPLLNVPYSAEQRGVAFQGGGDFSASGLTKREHFAVVAMQGMLAGDPDIRRRVEFIPRVVNDALAIADALIAALNETEQTAGA